MCSLYDIVRVDCCGNLSSVNGYAEKEQIWRTGMMACLQKIQRVAASKEEDPIAASEEAAMGSSL